MFPLEFYKLFAAARDSRPRSGFSKDRKTKTQEQYLIRNFRESLFLRIFKKWGWTLDLSIDIILLYFINLSAIMGHMDRDRRFIL